MVGGWSVLSVAAVRLKGKVCYRKFPHTHTVAFTILGTHTCMHMITVATHTHIHTHTCTHTHTHTHARTHTHTHTHTHMHTQDHMVRSPQIHYNTCRLIIDISTVYNVHANTLHMDSVGMCVTEGAHTWQQQLLHSTTDTTKTSLTQSHYTVLESGHRYSHTCTCTHCFTTLTIYGGILDT